MARRDRQAASVLALPSGLGLLTGGPHYCAAPPRHSTPPEGADTMRTICTRKRDRPHRREALPEHPTVQENQGNAALTEDGALVPFSVGSWIARNNGVAPDFSKAVVRRDVADHLSLVVTAPDEPAPVTGHPGLLARVVANLLDNAERHAATTITITLTVDRERRQAVVDVANDGPPIPPEHRETIFERFSRLDDARTRDAGGTGLGLAIARRITTLHHGTLTLAPGREQQPGARFTVRLPLTHEDAQPLVTEILQAWDEPDDIPALLTHSAGHRPLEDVVPDLARALVTAGRDHHLRALLRHVARQAPAWEVTGLADILRDEGMPAAAEDLLAARTAQRRRSLRGARVR